MPLTPTARRRLLLRLSLVAALLSGLFGYGYSLTSWQVDLTEALQGFRSGNADAWLDLISRVLETLIQIFFGLLSG